jgi:hypothetical protein
MGRKIDTASQTADDGDPPRRQIRAQSCRNLQRDRRYGARPDNGDGRRAKGIQVSAVPEHRRHVESSQ